MRNLALALLIVVGIPVVVRAQESKPAGEAKPAAAAALTTGPSAGSPGDWYQFLGPSRANITESGKLQTSWPTNGPRVVWKVPCEVGHAGPSIRDGILVLAERNKAKDSDLVIRGLDIAGGKELWRTPFPCSWAAPRYTHGPAAQPAISAGKVVCLNTDGKLRCLDLKTGKLAWEKDLIQEYKMPEKGVESYGTATAPLVTEDLVIVQVCAGDTGLVAWKLTDGKEAWRTPVFANFDCSPTFMQVGQKPVVIALAGHGAKALRNSDLFGFDSRDGSLQWYVKTGKAEYNCPVPIPADGGMVFLEGGGGDGPTVAVRLPEAGEGEAKVEWKDPDHLVRFSAYLAYKGLLFGQGYKAHGSPTKFFCFDQADGKLLWENAAKETQQWLLGCDGKVLHLHENGELAMFDADARAGYKELARARVIDKTWAPPALAGGRMYIRSDTQVVCLDLAGKP